MSAESNQPENDFSVIEELTAYLDGELDQEQIQQVEKRLGEDRAYLAEMQSLQKTWDLLDTLPATEPGTSFTKTTMELVVGEAVKSEKSRRNRSWVWPGRIAIMLAVPALLFASAFGVIRKLQTESDRLLIENLSVIENQSRYDSIECDMEFLQQLSDEAFFSDPTMFVDDSDSIVDIYASEESKLVPVGTEERRTYVESLDLQKKLRLKRKFEDFQKKSEAERKRLSDFDARLTDSEQRVRLTSTLTAYYDWLLKLESGERSDLRDLPASERISRIRNLRERQAVEELSQNLTSQEDARFILGWCESMFRLKENEIRQHFPQAVVRYAKDNNKRPPPDEFIRRRARHGNLNSIVDFLIRSDRLFIEDLILDDRQMEILYNLLSPKTTAILEDRTPEQRRALILNWVESANESKRDISFDTLAQFEQRLTVKERDQLEKMSFEDYSKTLKRMYLERHKSQDATQDVWEQEWEKILASEPK